MAPFETPIRNIGLRWPRLRPALARALSIAMDVALVSTLAIFAYAHVSHVIVDRAFSSVPFAAEQSLLAVLTLVRRRGTQTSRRAEDWLVASFGAWLPLLMRVSDNAGDVQTAVGFGLQALGAIGSTCCFLFLGRSFGVVAANRGLKTRGPYRVIRHPAYAAHMVTTAAFVIVNPTLPNAALFVAILAFTLGRIRSEERFLTETSSYADYSRQVRWRLVPGLI